MGELSRGRKETVAAQEGTAQAQVMYAVFCP